MCGISGLFDTQGLRSYDRALVSRINDIQAHRGPDEDDLHLEPGLALGHRRLSVIDLATGQQPQFNADASVGIVFNGEIYNFQELVPELKALGYVFRTRSDTEVIVHAWSAWARPACTACVACSPSPSGTARSSPCSSRATAWASSPCTTPGCPTAVSSSAPNSR